MKKFACFLIAALFALTAFATLGACGKTSVDAEEIPVDVNLDVNTSATLKMGIMDDASEKKTAQAFIDKFNETYKNIKVEIETISGDYMQAMLSRIKAKTVPDIFWVGDNNISYFAEKKLLLNLDRYIEAAQFDTSAYYTSMIKLGQKNQNGSQYMLPRDYNKVVCMYNKDLLEDAGVTKDSPLYPNDDWTYEEFLALCAHLRANLDSSVYPVDAMLAWPPVFNSFIRSFGGELMSIDGKPAFNTEEAKQGMQVMKELLDKRYTLNPINKTEDVFLAGKAAMWFTVRPSVSNCMAANLNINVASFPKVGEHAYIGAGTSGYGISRSTSHPNEAWALLSFMLSRDGQEAFSTTGNAVPVLRELASDEDAVWKTIPDSEPRFNHSAFVKYDERDTLKDYLNGVDVELYSRIDSAMLDLLDRYMGWTGSAENPDTLLPQKVKDINKILNSN